MKRTKKLLVLLISVAALMALLAVAVSAACNDFYFDMYGETLNVGDKVYAVESKYLQDLSNSNYGVRNTYRYSYPEDSGVVRSGDYLIFTKSGTVTITVKHGMYYERTGGSGTHTHTVTYTVKEPTAIYPTTIKLNSGAFKGGQTFPAFTTVSGAPRATVADSVAAFLECNLNESLCDAGTRVRRAEEVFLIDRARLHCGDDVVVNVIVAEVEDVELRRARLESLFLESFKLVSLTDVTRDRDDLAVVVVFLEPRDDDRGIETARICKGNFLYFGFVNNFHNKLLILHKYARFFEYLHIIHHFNEYVNT